MRQIVFILVLSLILVPVAAVNQGLISPKDMNTSDLIDFCDAAVTKVSAYYGRAEHWLRAELR